MIRLASVAVLLSCASNLAIMPIDDCRKLCDGRVSMLTNDTCACASDYSAALAELKHKPDAGCADAGAPFNHWPGPDEGIYNPGPRGDPAPNLQPKLRQHGDVIEVDPPDLRNFNLGQFDGGGTGILTYP